MKRKLQKGFTLVELIVVMILMGVIMTAVVMILRPSQRTFSNITNKAYEEQITLNMSKLLNGSLRYATGVKVICTHEANDQFVSKPTGVAADQYKDFKSYIKLSNCYRTSSVKGARGNFERGRVNGATLKATGSAISSGTFDEYDFQFSIPEYNSATKQQSMTIGVKAMAMDIGEDEEITAATDIHKPNPEFIPNFDKSYQYTETFEFVNLRNEAVINKKTYNVDVAPYKYGTLVDDLDENGDGYYDPAESGAHNTIWIFFTNPNEAEDKPDVGGGTPAPGGGTPAPGGGTTDPGDEETGYNADMKTGKQAGMGATNGNGGGNGNANGINNGSTDNNGHNDNIGRSGEKGNKDHTGNNGNGNP